MIALQQPVTDRMPTDRQRLALEGFFGIMQRWGLDNSTARRIRARRLNAPSSSGRKARPDGCRKIRCGGSATSPGSGRRWRSSIPTPISRTGGSSGRTRTLGAQLRSNAWRPAT